MAPPEEFTIQGWIKMLQSEYIPASEQVIFITQLPSNFEMDFPKAFFETHFPEYKSLKFQDKGEGVRLIGSKRVKQIDIIPDRVRLKLKLHKGDTIALTKENKFYWIKRFSIQEITSQVPGINIIDQFTQSKVIRQIFLYSPSFEELSDLNQEIQQSIPPLNYDPLESLDNFEGFAGYLSRRYLSSDPLTEDFSYEAEEIDILQSTQNPRGDWNHNLVETAINGLKLMQLGIKTSDFMIKSAVEWILKTPEPAGYPGMFMGTVKITERFNAWKKENESKTIVKFAQKEKTSNDFLELERIFHRNLEIIPFSNDYMLLSPTQTVLQFILQAGDPFHPRISRAINSILSVLPYWGHSHRILRLTTPIIEKLDRPDFNGIPISHKSSEIFKFNPKKIMELDLLTDDHVYVQLTDEQGIYEHVADYQFDCSFEIHASLSHHPGYRGSKLEFVGASDLWKKQSHLGYFGKIPFSACYYFLGLNSHPLSKFMALRSLPALVQLQNEDGTWDEAELSPFLTVKVKEPNEEAQGYPITHYHILSTLKTLSLFEAQFGEEDESVNP